MTESFTDWCKRKQQESVQVLENNYATISSSSSLHTKQGNFLDFLEAFENIWPWMFALDHVNCAMMAYNFCSQPLDALRASSFSVQRICKRKLCEQ